MSPQQNSSIAMLDNNTIGMSASLDHTNLYKSCVKTIRARCKASGTALPAARIFPKSALEKNKDGTSQVSSVNNSETIRIKTQFFPRARDIHQNVVRHKQLLNDHKRKYIGKINDPSSMTQEECIYMEKIISNNLKSIEEQLKELESKVSAPLLQALRKSVDSLKRPGDSAIEASKSGIDITGAAADAKPSATVTDVDCCMAVTAAIVRASVNDLIATFDIIRQTKTKKQTVKAKLMRLQRPAGVEKHSTQLMRQQQQLLLQNETTKKGEDRVATDSRDKAQREDWRDDEEVCNGPHKSDSNGHRKEDLSSLNGDEAASSDHTHTTTKNSAKLGDKNNCDNRDLDDSVTLSNKNNDKDNISKKNSANENLRYRGKKDQHPLSEGASTSKYTAESCNSAEETAGYGVDEANHQMLEQENMQMYNELQSEQEEVRKIARAVVELGRLQDVILENVESQSHVADSAQHQVMTATENVQEGNEQIREAMRKDASFRVWIMFFLIVMSFTILFLDWYND